MMEMVLTSSVLILLLAILRQALRGRIRPCVQYALWLLAAARLLVPGTLFTAPVSVAGATQELQTALYEAFPDPDDLPEPLVNEIMDQLDPAQPASVGYPDGDTVVVTRPVVPDITQRIYNWPDLIWKAGIAVTGGALVASNLVFYLRLRKSRRRLVLPDAPWSGKLPVYVAGDLPSPCLFGLFRPAIYLNEAAMGAEHPEHILAHEYAHYRHGDHVWSILRSICLAIHWYNPLVWWAAALSRRDCELACDEAALRRLGEDARIDYGQTLLGMVARGRNPAALLRTATTMTAGKRAMKERIALIVKQPKMRKITAALLVLVVCGAVAVTFGGKAVAAETESDPGDAVPASVWISQAYSSQLDDSATITDPEEVARLWELYQNFEYGEAYDPAGLGGWAVTVSFWDSEGGEIAFFILSQHGIYTQDGEHLRLGNIDEIYTEFLRLSRSGPVTPADLDPTGEIMQANARSIVEQIQNGAEAGEWLPLMNYMDWRVLGQAAVEAGMDDGDGSIAKVDIIWAIEQYVEEHGATMTTAEYLYILSASSGLDGAPSEGYGAMIYRMYERNPSQFAYVVLEMLPEEQRNEVLDHFRWEWYYYQESSVDTAPTREEAIAQLEADLTVGIFAAPSEMTLHSAGSTFQFKLSNASGIYALTYASSDPNVAAVDESGVVTAVGPGETIVSMHYEGAGGPMDFECAVRCEWENADTSQAAAPAEPPGELLNEWQRAFSGYAFNMISPPTQELIYDDMDENGIENAIIASLTELYQTEIDLYDNPYNARVSRIILESEVPTSADFREMVVVDCRVEFVGERSWNGQTYQLAPQLSDRFSAGFEVKAQSVVAAEMQRVEPLLYEAGILSSGAITGEEKWSQGYIREDILSRVNEQIQANEALAGYSARYLGYIGGDANLPTTIVSGDMVEIQYELFFSTPMISSNGMQMGPYQVTYTFLE